MRPYSRARATGETVREVVARTLIEDVADPRLEFVTVTAVEMSPDLRHANVFVAVHGGEARGREAISGLDSAKGRIRSLLGAEIRMRYVPELHFRIDPALDEATRIEAAIRAERLSGRVPEDQEKDEERRDEDA